MVSGNSHGGGKVEHLRLWRKNDADDNRHRLEPLKRIRDEVGLAVRSILHAAFVYAAAATCLHHAVAPASDEDSEDRNHRIDTLIYKSAGCLGPLTRQSSVSMRYIVARVFLANCFVAVEDPKSAFLYLRQAASMLETYRVTAQVDAGQCDTKLVRLYWLIFVHERYQCIAEYRNPLLKPLSPPTQKTHVDPMADRVGFLRVVSLFQVLDDVFIQHWLGESGREPITPIWVAREVPSSVASSTTARGALKSSGLRWTCIRNLVRYNGRVSTLTYSFGTALSSVLPWRHLQQVVPVSRAYDMKRPGPN